MARPCTVCTSGRRAEVDEALSRSGATSRVAANTGIPLSTLRRHATACAGRAVALAVSAARLDDLESGIGLTREAVDLQRRTIAILTEAEGSRQLGTALGAIREARGNLELLGKLTGRIRPEVQVNVGVILGSPAWQTVEAALLDELEAVPGALEALERGMRRLGRGDA